MKPEKPKNIRYGVLGDDDKDSLIRMAQPLTDPVGSWENAAEEDIAALRAVAIEHGTPEDRLAPGFHQRVLEITGSDESRDRYNSRILVDGTWNGQKYGEGWQLEHYRRNPVFMPLHDYDDVPVGQALNVYTDVVKSGDVERKRLRFVLLFTTKDENPLGDTIHRLYRGGFMRASSVGWWPTDVIRGMDEEQMREFDLTEDEIFSPRVYPTNELWELSAVPIPGNPNALIEDKFTPEEVRSFREVADQALEVAPDFAGQIKEYLDTKHVEQIEVPEEVGESNDGPEVDQPEGLPAIAEGLAALKDAVDTMTRTNEEMAEVIRQGFASVERTITEIGVDDGSLAGANGSDGKVWSRDQYREVLGLTEEIKNKLGSKE